MKQLFYQNLENVIYETKGQIIFEKKLTLIMIISSMLICLFTGLYLNTQPQLVSIIGILMWGSLLFGALFFIIAVYFQINEKARQYCIVDSEKGHVILNKNKYTRESISDFKIKDFGANYISLVMETNNQKAHFLITIKKSDFEILQKLKNKLDQDFITNKDFDRNDLVEEPIAIELKKFKFIISFVIGIVFLFLGMSVFKDYYFVSIFNKSTSVPFWTFGLLAIIYSFIALFAKK